MAFALDQLAANPGAILGLTAEEYAAACALARVSGGREGAMKRFARLYRDGDAAQPALFPRRGDLGIGVTTTAASLAPVARTIASDSPEGRVLKFTQLVPGRAAADPPVETESVIIPMIGRSGRRTYTLCVSSQVGCAMGCTFCQTAQMGLIRSLEAHEIVGQWFAARHVLLPDPAHGMDPEGEIANVVFMGMGEPMDNLENVIAAIAVLTDHRGPELPMSKVTISTVGRIDGIRRLAQQVHKPGWHRIGLAISLNAPDDEVRSKIMPVNRGMPMADLREALEEWPIYGGFKFCLEYVLIPTVNDRPEHALALAEFILGRGRWSGRPRLAGLVNLIPYNPRDGSPWPAPDEADVDLFLLWLTEAGVYAKRRRTKGRDTMAACGQLGNPLLRRARTLAGAPVALTRAGAS